MSKSGTEVKGEMRNAWAITLRPEKTGTTDKRSSESFTTKLLFILMCVNVFIMCHCFLEPTVSIKIWYEALLNCVNEVQTFLVSSEGHSERSRPSLKLMTSLQILAWGADALPSELKAGPLAQCREGGLIKFHTELCSLASITFCQIDWK